MPTTHENRPCRTCKKPTNHSVITPPRQGDGTLPYEPIATCGECGNDN